MPETELYDPIKAYLMAQGYEVKGEVGAADVVACRGDEPPVIVELKTGFTLSLFHQCIERQSVTDLVYLAVPRGHGPRWPRSLKDNTALCKRLGLGVITVRLRDSFVEVHLDPAAYRPRKNARRRARLLREFARRVGDPNRGGATRTGLVTAYRQDALRCAACLSRNGPTKGALVAKETAVAKATRIMADDHYGWFERVEKGIYALTPKGSAALGNYQS
jgi:hypothetical protein